MSNVWFTADTHFGHKAMAAAGKGWRPFDTIEEHDAHLVEQWNSVVHPDDQVWHLGDVGMGSDEATLALVGSLPGHKHLIAGNHDSVWSGHRQAHKVHQRWLEVFESVQPFARRRLYGKTVLLSHFPYTGDHTEDERYTQFRLPDLGDWLIHGHVHDVWSIKDRQINVGVDVRSWRPVHLDEIAAMMGNWGGPRRVDDLDVAEAMLTNLRDADQSPGGRPAGGAREAGHIRSPWEGCTCVIFGTAYDVGELDPVCPRHGAGRSPAMDVDRE